MTIGIIVEEDVTYSKALTDIFYTDSLIKCFSHTSTIIKKNTPASCLNNMVSMWKFEEKVQPQNWSYKTMETYGA